MDNGYYQVSGHDPNADAKVAYVWSRAQAQEDLVLVGSGYIVGSEGDLPPGIRPGQFAITFQLPPNCSAESIAVTDSKASKDFLPDVTLVRC